MNREGFFERLTDPRLWNAWKHPLIFMILLCALVVVVTFFTDIVYTMANKVLLISGEEAGAVWLDKNLGDLAISVLWVVGFSVGLVGSIVTALNILRLRTKRTTDFSRLARLTEEEHMVLSGQLDREDLSARNLSALWGVKEEEM